MAGIAWMRVGTITVTSGSRAVVGVDTVWGGGVVSPGDMIQLPNGQLGEVEAVTSNTGLTLKLAYTGATASAQPYAIIRMLPSGNIAAELAASLVALIQRYGITVDQLQQLLDSTGTVSFSDGTTTLYGLHGLRRLMADVAAKAPTLDPSFVGNVVAGQGRATSGQPAHVLAAAGLNKLSLQVGSGTTVSAGVHDAGGVARFNGAGVLWGDLGYYPAAGLMDGGHFRFSVTANVFDPSPNATLGVGGLFSSGPVKVGAYTLGTLPAASVYGGCSIMVGNAAGGPALCLSNGVDWINIRTNTPVN